MSPLSPDDGEEAESPMPTIQTKTRRGAISAEPITEEDASSYVKKVNKIRQFKKKPNISNKEVLV